MTAPFAKLLSPSLVTLDLAAPDGEAAIRAVAGRLAGHPAVADAGRFAAEVLERERLSTTALGNGVALPHARTAAVRDIVMAVGRCREGVAFGPEGARVYLIFVLGTPPDRAPEYLALVGRLARLLKNEAVREDLLKAATPEQFIGVLQAGG